MSRDLFRIRLTIPCLYIVFRKSTGAGLDYSPRTGNTSRSLIKVQFLLHPGAYQRKENGGTINYGFIEYST